MFHGNVKGRSYGNERVEISRESDYCLEFDAICLTVALPATLKNVARIVYTFGIPAEFFPLRFVNFAN